MPVRPSEQVQTGQGVAAREKVQERWLRLKLPQVRVLQVLCLGAPALTRDKLCQRCGFSPISGTLNRTLRGLREGSPCGDAHPGLLELGLVRCFELDVEGEVEAVHEATDEGRLALAAWIGERGEPPPLRDRRASTNKRYKKT